MKLTTYSMVFDKDDLDALEVSLDCAIANFKVIQDFGNRDYDDLVAQFKQLRTRVTRAKDRTDA